MVGQNKNQIPHTGNDQDTHFCITYNKLYSGSITESTDIERQTALTSVDRPFLI